MDPLAPGYAPISLQISAENSANPLDFSPTNTPADRTNDLTTLVPWKIDGSVNGNTYDTWQWRGKRTTPNLANSINPIFSLTDWQIGNDLSLIFQNDGSGTFVRRVIAKDAITETNFVNYWSARLVAAYTLDNETTLSPSVLSVTRAFPDPTSGSSVDFTVIFSESVTGVDTDDFTPNATGVTGATVTSITGSGSVYTVTVNTGAGNGTIRLDLLDDDSILDVMLYPLGGTGVGNGNFTTGEVYTVDKVPPSVISSVRANSNPTSLPNVDFTVTFSEAVTNVDFSDFTLAVTGVTGAFVSDVSGSGSVYTVSVYTGVYDGTIRLDVIDNDSILDAGLSPLGGIGAGNGNFITGEVYTVDKTTTLIIKSVGVNDGWVLESTETSGVGGSLNSTVTTFILGDDAANKQYRAILHFDTSSLPDWVVITSVTLKIQKQGGIGSNPFTALGSLAVDIRKPYFSSSVGLTTNDFQAAASQASVATFNETPVGNWYNTALNAAGISNINLTGTTQFRLRFTTDDNNDLGADYFTFSSGDAGAANRPQLIIEYFIPMDSPVP
ncbi:MAG: DNRLRE domain-containing protein [Chloroflexota bacterium]